MVCINLTLVHFVGSRGQYLCVIDARIGSVLTLIDHLATVDEAIVLAGTLVQSLGLTAIKSAQRGQVACFVEQHG